MSPFLWFLVVCVLIYCVLSWLLPKFLAWLLKRKYNIDLCIGRIGLPYFTIHDVLISKNGYNVNIQEVGFRSSFFSSEVTKLVSVIIKDVRINKDVHVSSTSVFSSENKTTFEDQRIPPMVITFVQFMAIHVYNVSVMFLRAESPEWLIHATAGELHLDGSIVHNARTLLINASIISTNAKLLRHALEKETCPQTCLSEVSFDISLEGTVIAQGPLSVEKLYVGMLQTKAVIHERFYSFAQKGNKHKSSVVEDEDNTDTMKRFFPIIPKNFTLKIENSVLTGMKENSRLDYSSSLQSLLLNTQVVQGVSLTSVKEPIIQAPQVFLSLEINNLDIRSDRDKLLEMSKLSVDGNFEDYITHAYIVLDSLSVSYHHLQVQPWIVSNFLRTVEKKVHKTKALQLSSTPSWFQKLCTKCHVSGCIELWKVSFLLKLPEELAVTSFGFSHMKLILDQPMGNKKDYLHSGIRSLFFSQKHWSAELLVESCWCRLGNGPFSTDPHILKKYHAWDTPLFMGVVLIKIRNQGVSDIKTSAMIDMLRAEWSSPLSQFLLQCLKCYKDYMPQGVPVTAPTTSATSKKQSSSSLSFNLTFTNTNLFARADQFVCLMLRLDKVNFDSVKDKMAVMMEGAKMVSLVPTAIQHSCVKSEDIKSWCGHIKLARINTEVSNRDLTIQLQDLVHIKWSPNLHLKILTLQEEILQFLNTVRPPSSLSNQQPSTFNWALRITGQIKLFITISTNHTMLMESEGLTVGSTTEYVGIETPLLTIAIDDSDIFSFKNFHICRIHDDDNVRNERKNSEGFVLPWNKTWSITVDLFKAVFPYHHNYAEAVHNELISIWKWLKSVHRKKKTAFTADSPLPSDLYFKIKEFLFEMSDDPFEVKLRDNFELLEDEYKESLKRQKMLDAKISELRKSHVLSMAPGKIEELNIGLRKKNAEIYIQRSKLMSKQAPPRTRLFAWLMSDLNIMALADPSIHGAENVVKVMTEIDYDSPWPEEGLEFTTLWCRSICLSWSECKFQLRDFPQPLLDIRALQMFGRLCGAEQEATKRARREVIIDLGEPWGQLKVERSMTALKFYHDLNCNVEHYQYAFGPCWEPVIAQCNLSFEKISPPSKDPSPALAFWDKMRLLFHGRLTMFVHHLTSLLHASLDPYNTTEEMELTWTDVAMDWTNGKFVFKGDFNVLVRTASKYDDCRLLHLPNLKLTLKLHWVCLADPNDHHSVMSCAPDKLPEYSSNQEHDSFRAFRSQNLSANISLETKPPGNRNSTDCPMAICYGSTLRWFENLKLILSGVTRPTRRGPVFNNLRPRKIPLSRHYKKVRLLLGLHKFQVFYWMSFSMQRGFELLGGRITFNSEHILNLSPIDDGLKHRPRSEWSVMCMNCDLNDTEIWLKSALQEDSSEKDKPVEKCYCLSVAKVSYGRETILPKSNLLNTSDRGKFCKDTPIHRLVVYDLKGAWTKSNRDVVFALFNAFMKSQQLKKNLSTEALKGFRGESSNSSSLKSRTPKATEGLIASPATAALHNTTVQGTPSPMTKQQSGHAASMLQQLIAEVDNKSIVFSDDMSVQTAGHQLLGLQSCQEDDVQYKNWLIVLVNSQVLLKGCETKGYVILSAAKAEILQRVHNHVWKDRTLVSKTSWVGSLDCMQYYATVAAGDSDALDENIMWLTVDNIQEKDNTSVIADVPDLPHLVGSGHSVGGVVTETVGASSSAAGQSGPVQLQRIVSRCKCEFFYACYGDTSIDPSTLDEVPSLPTEETVPWEKKETAVDAFTLMHYELDCSTNSLQYSMILDIVNNLLLHLEPHRKVFNERLQRMRFQLALHSIEDQRKPIQELQNHVRSLVSKLRRLEKESYLVQKMLSEESDNKEIQKEMVILDKQVFECKDMLMNESEELEMMLSCYKESQLSANQKLSTTKNDKPVATVRANEIVFKHAKWRLTETDGQLGIADLVLSNFLYTKNSKSDDSVEHLLQLGYVRMTNLLPYQTYTEVLQPTELQSNMPVDRKTAVRVFCREKAPVGGISVKEHFEINVVPLTIGLTKMFFNTMLAFCFPERDPENIEGDPSDDLEATDSKGKKNKSNNKKGKETTFYLKIAQKDDVEKMKERAEKNKLFIYIKIPEVPVRVSYKGNKEKNLEDIRDFSLVIPTLEYHNVTWTWLDLLLAMKNDSRRVILSQAIKQKLQIKTNRNASKEGASPQEEDKAKMLFGARVVAPAGGKSLRRTGSKLGK